MLYQWSWIACLTSLCRASGENWGPFPQAPPFEILWCYLFIGICAHWQLNTLLTNSIWIRNSLQTPQCLMLVCYVCWSHVSLLYDWLLFFSLVCKYSSSIIFLLLQSTFIITVCNFSCAPGILAPTCWFMLRFHPVLTGRANIKLQNC